MLNFDSHNNLIDHDLCLDLNLHCDFEKKFLISFQHNYVRQFPALVQPIILVKIGPPYPSNSNFLKIFPGLNL